MTYTANRSWCYCTYHGRARLSHPAWEETREETHLDWKKTKRQCLKHTSVELILKSSNFSRSKRRGRMRNSIGSCNCGETAMWLERAGLFLSWKINVLKITASSEEHGRNIYDITQPPSILFRIKIIARPSSILFRFKIHCKIPGEIKGYHMIHIIQRTQEASISGCLVTTRVCVTRLGDGGKIHIQY